MCKSFKNLKFTSERFTYIKGDRKKFSDKQK